MEGQTIKESSIENTQDTNSNSISKAPDFSLKITDSDLDNLKDGQEICKFYLEGACRFADKCFNYHLGDIPQKSPRKLGRKDKGDSDEGSSDEDSERKAKMKTAHDVINRIKWDSDFAQENFTIGYTDRFKGLIEAEFASFTWEDLASLDWETFAIPQHRIQYFKYRGEKVWEKSTRLDLVFGSTGSDQDIVNILTDIDNRLDSTNE